MGETADDALIDGEEDNDHAPGFHVPGCGDKYGKADATTSPPEEGPSDPVLKCHGVGGDVWMLSRDQAVSAAEQFCKQDAKDIQSVDRQPDPKQRLTPLNCRYFQGSADDVKLSLHNHDDSKPISAVADCIGNFKVIIDGCDGNNPTHNPHNYKFGGVSTTTDGWEFKLEPQAKKPTENSCDVSYEFWEDLFEVRGKNFPDAKLGADGEGLKKEIKGCGALTDWSFEWTPDDAKYQWYARGHLPIGTKSCMGRAVQTAGGASSGGCRGAG